MFPEFTLDGDGTPREPLSPEEEAQLERAMSRYLKPEDQQRLERLLLERLKQRKAELQVLWEELNGHWGYEVGFYRLSLPSIPSPAGTTENSPVLQHWAGSAPGWSPAGTAETQSA